VKFILNFPGSWQLEAGSYFSTLLFRPNLVFPSVTHHLEMNAISLEHSIEMFKSTTPPLPRSGKGQSIWNDSTSSFRYPCLVTT
jgi:hypothetical protein